MMSHKSSGTRPFHFGRRGLMQASFLTAVATLLRAGQTPVAAKGESVIIVGAGMAGLAAARDLRAKGYTVLVLEGRDRIGGRIRSDRSLGPTIDLGASWIHGVKGNPISRLADDFSVTTAVTDYDNATLYDADGHTVAAKKRDDEFATLLKRAKKIGRDLDRDISVAEALRRAMAETPPSAPQQTVFQWIRADIEVDYAAGLDQISIQAFNTDDGFGGDDVLFPGGYDQIVRGLATGLDIRLNSVVRRIAYGDDGVRAITDNGDFSADYAVVTVPLGVLKAGTIAFAPTLPNRKRAAIRNMDMGVLNKVVLAFPRAFWPTERDFIYYVGATPGAWPEFLNLAHYTGDPILIALTGAAFARSLESRTDGEIAADAMRVLRTLSQTNIPEPTGLIVTRWASDPFAFGSYSHIPVGATVDDYAALAQPLGDRLFFAGEATISDYPATVHGAFFSGVRAAAAIASG